MSRDCKTKLGNRCLPRTNAKCTDYEGMMVKEGWLDPLLCHNVEDAIDLLGDLIEEIQEDIDVSELGCCMTYTVADEEKGLTVKDVISSHEGMLCDHEERLNQIEDNCCNGVGEAVTEDTCGKPVNSTISFLKHSFGTGDVSIDNTYGSFKPIPSSSYNDLFYKCEFTGLHEIVVETVADTEGKSISIGLSKNNFTPNNTPFEQTVMKDTAHNTTHFIIDATKNDIIRLHFKKETGTTTLTSVKMIVKLIQY